MLSTRVIPVLLLHNKGLVKTTNFKKPVYIGDPINAIKIFNDKEVDELVFYDIDASKEDKEPNYNLISAFATECFMTVCYGGGVNSIEQIRKIFSLGIELRFSFVMTLFIIDKEPCFTLVLNIPTFRAVLESIGMFSPSQ